MALFNNLPLYQATLNDEADGICVISLVSDPAVESGWMAFKKEDINKKSMSFSIENEDEHLLLGVLMRADYPIYRYNWITGEEYYISYSKDTIKHMCEKMLKDGTFNNIDIEHNGEILPQTDVSLVECFIKDVEKGINPAGFEDVSDGSLFIKMKVHNPEIWNLWKGDDKCLTGFSLYGYFSIEQEFNKINKIENNKNKMKKLKELLAAVFIQFGKIGDIYFDAEEIAVGTEVFDKDGNPYADGEYVIDGMKYTIKYGKVEEIEKAEEKPAEEPKKEEPIENGCAKKLETEEPKAEEPKAEEPKDEPKENPEIDNLKKEISELRSLIEALSNRISDLEGKPSTEPIAEQFTKIAEAKTNAMNNILAKFQKD